MAKGMTKRTRDQKRKELARKKAAYRAWVPRRVNKANITYPATFLDLARELRDMVYDKLLLFPAEHKIPLSPDLPPPSRAEAEALCEVLRAFCELSLVSKQVHAEAEETLFQRNAFSVELASFEDRGNYGRLAPDASSMAIECKLLSGLTESVIPKLRTITVYDRAFWWIETSRARSHSSFYVFRYRCHREEARSVYTLRLLRPSEGEVAVGVKHEKGLQEWKSRLYRLKGLLEGWKEEQSITDTEMALLEALVPLEGSLQARVEEVVAEERGFERLSVGLLRGVALAGRGTRGLGWRDPSTYRPFVEDALESV